MPLQKLQFKPGVTREVTNYTNEGGWYDCDKVRFRAGFPQKIGGWARATPGFTYAGVARSMINWVDLSSNNLIGLGTNSKYYVNRGLTEYKNITPIRKPPVTLGNNPFSVTNGSNIITVTDTTHGAVLGDYVTFSGAIAFNTFTATDLNKEFEIVNIVNANTYQVASTIFANATTTGGGAAVVATYQLNVGNAAYSVGNGFGAGVWNSVNTGVTTTLVYTSGSGNVLLDNISTTINVNSTTGFSASGTIRIDSEIITYSALTPTSFTGCVRGTSQSLAANHALDPTTGSATPPPITVYQVTNFLGTTGWGNASVVNFGTGIGQQLRLWSQDTFGQDLLINPRGGKIYYWQNNTSTYPPAVALSTDVQIVATNQVVVSDVSRFVIAMGCNSYGDLTLTFDPLLVRWSDQENPNIWTPLATNQSGESRLTNGSFIMTSKKTRQEILIWTDAALYSMQYLGPPYVFGFTLLMDNLSIMSPNAATVVNNVAYWMGTDKFYAYSGRVDTLPCSVREYVFNDLNFDQRFQIVSGSNEGFNEIWWYYVSNQEVALAVEQSRTPRPDKYVIYNHLDQTWYYGSLSRTFWLDTPLQSNPLAALPLVSTANLLTGISSVATSITLTTTETFRQIGEVQIGTEKISYVGISGNTLLNCSRGHEATTPASHAQGAVVAQINTNVGTLLFQEFGNDDASTAAPQPFTAYIQSSDFDIGDGYNIGFVSRIIPDISFSGSSAGFPAVVMQIKPRYFSGSNYGVPDDLAVASAQQYSSTVRSYTVQQYSQQISTRVRGRQMSFRIESGGQLGTNWQLGSPRIDIQPDGLR